MATGTVKGFNDAKGFGVDVNRGPKGLWAADVRPIS